MVSLQKFQCDSDRCNGLNETELLDASVPPFTQEPIEIQTTTGGIPSETTQAAVITTGEIISDRTTTNQIQTTSSTSSKTTHTATTTSTKAVETTSTTDGADSDDSFYRTLLSVVYLLTIML